MISWQHIARNALWILGAAILLADFSYMSWLAHEEKRPLRQLLATPRLKRGLWLGLAMIGAGLALTSDAVWELVIWVLLTLLALISLWRIGR
jgi:hypothetical protein